MGKRDGKRGQLGQSLSMLEFFGVGWQLPYLVAKMVVI